MGASFQLAGSTRWKSCRHKRHDGNLVTTRDTRTSCRCGFSCPRWLQVFNLQDRQDEILSPQETRWNLVATRDTRTSCRCGSSCPMWLQVFPCGCKFSTCRIDTMKSCRHKRHENLVSLRIQLPQVAASFPMWLQVFNLQDRQDEILSPQETR